MAGLTIAGRKTEGTPDVSLETPLVWAVSSSATSSCLRLFPMTIVGIPPRGNAADGVDMSSVLIVSDTTDCAGRSLDSGIEPAIGAFALLPRNIGATLFFPSLVMVIFCCMTCGEEVARCKQYYICGLPATVATDFGVGAGIAGFGTTALSCTGVCALPMTAAIILAGASASFSFDFFSNSN